MCVKEYNLKRLSLHNSVVINLINVNYILLTIISCVNLLVSPDDAAFLRTAHTIYIQQAKFPEALTLAIRLGDRELIREDFEACEDRYVLGAFSYLILNLVHQVSL